MSLSTDKFFYSSLSGTADVNEATDGRIFNTARPQIDETEDKIPYIIISHDGVQNEIESKDDVGEADTDRDTITVLVVAEDRNGLADLAELVRKTIKQDMADFDDEMEEKLGFGIDDYTFSASPVEYDDSKPCFFQALTYVCETYNVEL